MVFRGRQVPADESQVVEAVHGDLMRLDKSERPFARYFTFSQLWHALTQEQAAENAKVREQPARIRFALPSPDDVVRQRVYALSKLLNSLSWESIIVRPEVADPSSVVWRIDLRDYGWDAGMWERVLTGYPYGIVHSSDNAKAIYADTDCAMPYIRGDWFIFAASRPPLYHVLLRLPETDRELERELGVNVGANLAKDLAARSGFHGSGVTFHNRVLERHGRRHRAYWRSYDFAADTGPRNVFAYPLGPGPSAGTFQHDGGEIIFTLPNGLQGYMLVDAQGSRLDQAPIAVVMDRVQGAPILNGISCISCHEEGMKGVEPIDSVTVFDQIRSHVAKNRQGFTQDEIKRVEALYLPREAFLELIKGDAERFKRAVRQTAPEGVLPDDKKLPLGLDPVGVAASQYLLDLPTPRMAAEVGLVPPEAFTRRLEESPEIARGLAGAKDGSAARRVFEEVFPRMVAEWNLGKPLRGPVNEWAADHDDKATTYSAGESQESDPSGVVQSQAGQSNSILACVYLITVTGAVTLAVLGLTTWLPRRIASHRAST
jgi:hypothetical protein